MSNRAKLMMMGGGIGLLPLPLGWIVPSSGYVAFVCPTLLSLLTLRRTRQTDFRQQAAWCCLTALCTTAAFTLSVALIAISANVDLRIMLGVLPAPFWLPWLIFFTLMPVTARYVFSRVHRIWRWPVTATVVAVAYLGSAAVCFDFSQQTCRTDVEQSDAQGREPALGPAILPTGRLICQPQGPSFLFSTDYSGSEWLWVFYRPLVHAWFVGPGRRYYSP